MGLKRIRWASASTLESPPKRQRATNSTAFQSASWEEHKEEILALRKTSPLKDVMKTMKDKGFNASEAQYKYHLKKWGDKKYTKFTAWHISYIVQQIMVKFGEGKKPAVRVNGKKVPSRRIEEVLEKNNNLVEKCAQAQIEKRENEDDKNDYNVELDPDRDGDPTAGSLRDAPTFIDSLRLTVYTSSTSRGIESRLLNKGQAKALSVYTNRTIHEDIFEDDGSEESGESEEEEEVEEVEEVEEPGEQEKDEPEAAEVKEGRGSKNEDPHRTLTTTTPRPPRNCTWRGIRRQIFHKPKRRNGNPRFGRLEFRPWLFLDKPTGRTVLWPWYNTGTPEIFNDRLAMDRLGSERFSAFLSTKSETQYHLYRREIDTNDCPNYIWAVDLLCWHVCIPGYYGANDITGCYGDNGENAQFLRRVSKWNRFCFAWCVRAGMEWNKWIEQLDSECKNKSRAFNCGHKLATLKSDGPVIFTTTLFAKCWQQDGCQWTRIQQQQSTSSGAKTVHSGCYMPWSNTSATLGNRAVLTRTSMES